MTHRTRSTGFTLVEVLIVVVILAILAALVIPQISSAGEESRANAVKMDLFRIRTQLEIYKQQHNSPPDLDAIADQLTTSTNSSGETAATGTDGFPLGPYLRQIPLNPYTSTRDIADITSDPGSSGWAYDEENGDFVANSKLEHREW